tara:strand:+ start:1222 stop:1671 length:450 start_codon:yes stop_codon:yes gene_type:complete
MIAEDRVIKLAKAKVSELGGFLVSVKLSVQNDIHVFVDKKEGISINECLQISRFIEEELDREVEDFHLSVSSPGLRKAFLVEEQYLKNIGREVVVKLTDGKKIKGRLLAYDGDITLETTNKLKNKKQLKIQEEIISSAEIKETKLIVKF